MAACILCIHLLDLRQSTVNRKLQAMPEAKREMFGWCRTLTPFGFQAEERTLWEATDTYINMSPYLQAHKIKKPLLLIHGEDDNNTGV